MYVCLVKVAEPYLFLLTALKTNYRDMNQIESVRTTVDFHIYFLQPFRAVTIFYYNYDFDVPLKISQMQMKHLQFCADTDDQKCQFIVKHKNGVHYIVGLLWVLCAAFFHNESWQSPAFHLLVLYGMTCLWTESVLQIMLYTVQDAQSQNV